MGISDEEFYKRLFREVQALEACAKSLKRIAELFERMLELQAGEAGEDG